MRSPIVVLLATVSLVSAPERDAMVQAAPAPSTVPVDRSDPPDAAQIRRTVRELNHPSPERRQAALRRLAEWGPFAFDALREAAAGPEHESALAARGLLTEFESAILVGGQVSLEVDPPAVAWNEPVALVVRVKNPTPAPLRVPWPASTTQPAAADADQVGPMLDVADFLAVIDPQGRPVALRFEPIEGDKTVYEAVGVRAGDNPPFSLVPPGGEAIFRLREFNTGWARFPLLVSGIYRVTFSYQPQWKDASWTAAGFGRVQAGPVSIEVARSAPQAICDASRPVELRIECRGDLLSARIVSTWDRPLHLNLNWGPDTARHAELRWSLTPAGAAEPTHWVPEPDSPGAAAWADRIRRLDAGGSVEIARVSKAVLLAQAAVPVFSGSCEVKLRYVNIAGSPQLRALATRPGAASAIPPSIYTGALHSEPLRIDTGPSGVPASTQSP